MESWLSGRKRRSWKPLMCKHPGVRIPNSPPCITSIEHHVFWLGLFFILGRDSTHKGFGLSTRTATSCSRFMLKTCHWQLFLTQSPLTLRQNFKPLNIVVYSFVFLQFLQYIVLIQPKQNQHLHQRFFTLIYHV